MAAISPTHLQPNNSTETAVSVTQHALGFIGLSLIILLGAFLRLYHLGVSDIGNTYYAATVQSMLLSWHNFFFVAFEPGGSVTVDKPPLGFWIQAISAYFLGVNGFALALPQALAGIFSLPLLYIMVKRHFGMGAGLIAVFVLATTPVTVSTERNNTIDGLLVFVLLLAAWAFLQAVYNGQARYLYLGALLIGLGFNIKMMQAFLPLPAFYAVYFMAAPHTWSKRLSHLLGATLLLITVSLSWAIMVDLTPPDQRPYIGSSTNNTVMQLVMGHNGFNRLFGGGPPPGQGNPPPPPQGQPPAPPQGNNTPPPNGGPPPGGPMGEVGRPSPWRLFVLPLASEASWLLPFALLGLGLLIAKVGSWQSYLQALTQADSIPLTLPQIGLLLWGGWLMTEVIFFSVAAFFHAYYLIMLGPPMAAMMGATWWLFNRPGVNRQLMAVSSLTLAFQIVILAWRPHGLLWLIPLAVLMLFVGGGLSTQVQTIKFQQITWAMTLMSVLIIPSGWSTATTFNHQPDVMLPHAGPNDGRPPRPDSHTQLAPWQQTILAYLLNHSTENYLAAVPSAQDASAYILAVKRPMLTFGGFSGGDNIVTAERLAQMVAQGELRFVIISPQLANQKPALADWITNHCTLIDLPDMPQVQSEPPPPPGNQPPGAPPRPSPANILYDCGQR